MTPPRQAVLTKQAPMVQLIDEAGSRHPDPEFDPWVRDIGPAELTALHRDMVMARRLDAEGTALQRQGELGLWPPLAGQEAAQIGSARALRADDFVFSSYREHAVAWCRGVTPTELMQVWRGTALSGWDPAERHMAVPQIIIGAQALHATGYAMGASWDGADSAAIAYFGDGATSEGDVSEALVFAASFDAPVVFFCQNNQWAISEPVGLQSKQPLAHRAAGFGMPGVRVDGNDVLAVMAAPRRALDRARQGAGPTLIEAVTYRLGPHTTADDPTRYRTEDDVRVWRDRDPIARVRAALATTGTDVEAVVREADDAAARAAMELRAGVTSLTERPPLSVFDHVYAEPNSQLERQRARYARYLDLFEGEADGADDADAEVDAEAGGGSR